MQHNYHPVLGSLSVAARSKKAGKQWRREKLFGGGHKLQKPNISVTLATYDLFNYEAKSKEAKAWHNDLSPNCAGFRCFQ